MLIAPQWRLCWTSRVLEEISPGKNVCMYIYIWWFPLLTGLLVSGSSSKYNIYIYIVVHLTKSGVSH